MPIVTTYKNGKLTIKKIPYNNKMEETKNPNKKRKTLSLNKKKNKLGEKQKILEGKYRTRSNIPKTPKQRKMFKRATAIAVKESGKYSEKNIPWPLVTTIYKKAEKADKIPKKSDIKKAKYSKRIASYS